MKKLFSYLIFLIIGVGIGVFAYPYLINMNNGSDAISTEGEDAQPLYWVAPMDPNYKRDQPGQSPMGMDLIPVYEENNGNDSPGTVRISPDVVNNIGVRTAQVEWSSFDNTINTVGYVKYDENRLIHIHPRVEGWIEKLHVKAVGDPVKAGDPLYDIYSPALVNAQEELVLALKRGNSTLTKAAKERLQALQIPMNTIETLTKTRKPTQTITVKAPRSGVIDQLNVREGFFVKPGTTMMSIGALDEVWVLGEIFERQMMNAKPGDEVVMKIDALPGHKWEGQVDYIYPTLDSKTRTAKIRMRFKNPEKLLKPDMFANLMIQNSDSEESLQIPKEALIRTGTQDRVVLALGEGKFKSINVTPGRIGSTMVEILDGLDEADRIVTSAQFMLDSESSKTSDFKRLHYGDTEQEQPKSVWVEAKINTLNPDSQIVNMDHPAIDEWQWPKMTMDFDVAQSIDMQQLKEGMSLHVEISKTNNGGYELSSIHVPDEGQVMDHSQHQGMDHSQHQNMDHSKQPEMDHSQHQNMDHSKQPAMDHSQHQNMDHSEQPEMDHSQHQNMDHSQHQSSESGKGTIQ